MAPPSASRRGPGTRSGSTSGAAVQLVGLKQLRRELRKLEQPREWTKALGRIHREIAKDVAGTARSYATRMGGSQKHFAAAIKGRGGVTNARISVSDDRAFAAFWGAKQRWTGWNARNAGDYAAANQPDWVGNTWPIGERGYGPYAINDAIADRRPWIQEAYADEVDDLMKRAFPHPD